MALVADLDQFADQGGGSGEARTVSALASGQAQSQGDMRFPVPLLPNGSTFSLRARSSHRVSSSTSSCCEFTPFMIVY
jgi:hypothetical protein